MNIDQTSGQVVASYDVTHALSLALLKLLIEKNVEVGYSLLALSHTIARAANSDRILTQEEEVQWLQDSMDFIGAYWTDKPLIQES